MKTISYTKARNEFSILMDKVCEDNNPVIITRQKQQAVVIMSLDHYNALAETEYLLRSPQNAQRLTNAIIDFKENRNFQKVTL